jgi:hypothetical protein
MKEQDFKTFQALRAIGEVCCYYTEGGWELYAYGDPDDLATCREVGRKGNRLTTARGDSRRWKSLDSLIDWLMRSGVKFSSIRLDGDMPGQAVQRDWTE